MQIQFGERVKLVRRPVGKDTPDLDAKVPLGSSITGRLHVDYGVPERQIQRSLMAGLKAAGVQAAFSMIDGNDVLVLNGPKHATLEHEQGLYRTAAEDIDALHATGLDPNEVTLDRNEYARMAKTTLTDEEWQAIQDDVFADTPTPLSPEARHAQALQETQRILFEEKRAKAPGSEIEPTPVVVEYERVVEPEGPVFKVANLDALVQQLRAYMKP